MFPVNEFGDSPVLPAAGDSAARIRGPGSKPSFRTVAAQLARIATPDHRRYLLTPVEKQLDYLDPEYLRDAAYQIDADVQRVLKASLNVATEAEFNYWGAPVAAGPKPTAA